MSRHNPLPANAEYIHSEDEAPVPGDIGLGAPVVASGASQAAHQAPLDPESLRGRPQLGRAAFLARYPLPRNVNVNAPIGRLA
jgi:hypothetical protein